MKCHYVVLGVDRGASDGDIKRAYRKLALQYHPDKNQDNVEESTRLFTAVQQAYEVLSDPQERAWYDKHREDILRGAGSDFKDDSVNLMPFFSTTCFKGYTDEKEGFYAVYADVFHRVSEEEDQYMDEGEEPLPPFGYSTSDYESVVHKFYSYWQSFSTRKSYAWVDQYDLREAPNRRVQRLMEKENKKLREAAKKKTNDTVRALVAFVRKRDKRVQGYKTMLEEKEAIRQKKVEEKRAKDRAKKLKQQEEYQRVDAAHSEAAALFEEEFQSLATQLDQEFGRDSASSSEESVNDDLFCPACNKMFRTDKAFANHQRSKKHKENAALLRKLLQEEDASMEAQKSHDDSDQSDHSTDDKFDQPLKSHDDPDQCMKAKSEQANSLEQACSTSTGGHTKAEGDCSTQDRNNDSSPVGSDSEDVLLSLLRNKQSRVTTSLPEEMDHPGSPPPKPPKSEDTGVPQKLKKKGKGKRKPSDAPPQATPPSLNYCNSCKKNFPSRNKLFQHIKETGHALHTNTDQQTIKSAKNTRRKK